MKKCGYCKKEIKPYAEYDLTEPIEDWLAPEEDRVIVDRKSWLNPMNTRRVNFEYIEAKKLFRTAQDTKSRVEGTIVDYTKAKTVSRLK